MSTITRGKNNSFNTFKKAKKFMNHKINEYIYNNAIKSRTPNMNYAIKNKNGNSSGFALISPTNNKGIYIHLLATKKGFGRILLQRIINNARKNNKYYIKLHSVPSAIGFYRNKFGFIQTENGMILNLYDRLNTKHDFFNFNKLTLREQSYILKKSPSWV